MTSQRPRGHRRSMGYQLTDGGIVRDYGSGEPQSDHNNVTEQRTYIYPYTDRQQLRGNSRRTIMGCEDYEYQSSSKTIATNATHGSTESCQHASGDLPNEEPLWAFSQDADIVNFAGCFDSSPNPFAPSPYQAAVGPSEPYYDSRHFEYRDYPGRPNREEVFMRDERTEHYGHTSGREPYDYLRQRHRDSPVRQPQDHVTREQQCNTPRPEPRYVNAQRAPHTRPTREAPQHVDRRHPALSYLEPQRNRRGNYRRDEDEA